MAIRVLLVDDAPAYVDALRSYLSLFSDIEVVGTATDGREAVELYSIMLPDVVLMDVSMPVMDGIAATRRIREADPNSRVVMLTMHNELETRRHCAAAGASQFVAKSSVSDELHPAIRRAFENGDTKQQSARGGV